MLTVSVLGVNVGVLVSTVSNLLNFQRNILILLNFTEFSEKYLKFADFTASDCTAPCLTVLHRV